MNLEEKEKKLWDENLHSYEQQDKQGNHFHQYLNPQDEEQTCDSDHSDNWILPFMDMEGLNTEDLPSIELNIKLVPCISSVFIQEIHQYRKEPQAESILVTKAQKFIIINSDGKSVSYLCKIEELLEQLKKLVNPDVFAVIDKNEIFFDFINYRPSYPLVLEYHIIEKQLLIQVQFRFQTQVLEYLTTSKCKISTIIHRFIDDNKLKSLSADLILAFFDEYGKCIDNGIIDDLCKTSSKTVVILVTEEVVDSNTLCEITLQYKEDHHETNLFRLTAQWQQIDLWLKTLLQDIDFPVDNYAFLTRQQKTIIENNDTISSVLNQSESATIDIINRNTITKVIFTYETHSQFVYALTSIKIASLLNDENLLRQLNLNDLSFDHYVLVLGESNEHILTKEDLQQSVGTYLTTGDQSIHFRISILVQITKYDDQEYIQILLSTRDTTIEQLLQLTRKSVDVYKYLALNDTKRIVDYQEIISNLNTTELILVKESETCLLSIKRSENGDEENEKDERYAVFASMADITQENQYLLYANDFVPSAETQLTSFQSAIPIRFTIIDDNLPVTVTIESKETDETITFNCSLSMTVKRIYAVSCQLFGLSNEFYQLMQDGSALIDDDMSLEGIGETMTNIQFQVTSTMSTHCSVRFAEQTITLPCNEDTPASTIVKETLKKSHIPYDDLEQYELMALNDEQTKIDFDTIIEDMRQLFSSTTMMLSFELRKTDG